MSEITPKKMLTMNIYNILKRHSDSVHMLTQKNIIDYLSSECGMEVERKAVKRNLEFLMEAEENIKNDINKPRTNARGEKEIIMSNWFYSNPVTDAEIHFLIDSLLSAKNIPMKFLDDLIVHLKGLTNKYFRHIVPKIRTDHCNSDFFLNIEIIYEAINNDKQISFLYNKFDTDKKLHPITDESSDPKVFIVDPYRTAMTNGRYYLIGREKDTNTLENYQIDRITDIKKLDTSLRKVKEIEKNFDLSEYVAEHIYMFSGGSERVTFRADRIILSDIVDWFGDAVKFIDHDEKYVTATVKVNGKAMKYWAIQYLKYVTVLSPKSLVDDIRSTISGALDNYNKE